MIAQKITSAPGMTLPPEQRSIGMVFQDPLFTCHQPKTSALGCARTRPWTAKRAGRPPPRCDRATGMGERYPNCPGAAAASHSRALAPRPTMLLMDEPFSNLDVELRERPSVEVRDLLKSGRHQRHPGHPRSA